MIEICSEKDKSKNVRPWNIVLINKQNKNKKFKKKFFLF